MRDAIVFVVIFALSYMLYTSGVMEAFILSLGTFMNLGVLVAGLFYSSSATVPLSIALFSTYLDMMSPLRIAMAASVGAMLSDTIFFVGFNKVLHKKVAFMGYEFKAPRPRTDLERAALMFLGGTCLATPFIPDELAVLVLSFSRMELNRFMMLSLVFKFLGILGVVWTFKFLQ